MYLYSIKMLKVEKPPEEFERFLILHGPKYKYNSKSCKLIGVAFVVNTD